MDYSLIAAVGFVSLTVICLTLFLLGLAYGLRQIGWAAERKNRYLLYTILILAAWLSFTGVMSNMGFFSDFEILPPPMFINLLIPIAGIVFWIKRPATKEILAGIPLFWLPALQAFRIPVEIFLWCLFMVQLLPEQLTFEGYNFDILSGILGLVLAILMYRGLRKSTMWLRLYNFLGLALLFTIVLMSILSMPTPFRQFMNEPSNVIMTIFPFIWLPAFLVPFAFGLHLLSLQQTKAYTSR